MNSYYPISQTETAKPCISKQLHYTMLLAPFQPATRIELETNINTDIECSLNVKNISNKTLNVRKTISELNILYI